VNVYVESNFVLELALLQEQHAACEEILRLGEAGELSLVLPAYSLVEPFEALTRRQTDRKHVRLALENQLGQVARSAIYAARLQELKNLASLLVDSAAEDVRRLESVRSRLLVCAEMVPLDGSILSRAAKCQGTYDLSSQDAVIYASILSHLERSKAPGCFLSRDGDFNDSEIKRELKAHNCALLPEFETGLQFLRRPTIKGTE
jgi:predicted nucleic acid-binding protein